MSEQLPRNPQPPGKERGEESTALREAVKPTGFEEDMHLVQPLPVAYCAFQQRAETVMYRVSDSCILDASPVERRHSTRYEIHTTVAFFWDDAEAKQIQGEGVTKDISDVGLYIVSEQCPPLKSKVQIEVLFGTANGPGISLTGSMQVVRIERNLKIDGVFGFAIAGRPLVESNAAQA